MDQPSVARPSQSGSDNPSARLYFGVAVLVLAGAFFLLHALGLRTRFLEFNWDGLALGNFSHLLWGLAHGQPMAQTATPLELIRVPMVLYPLAPLYRLWPNPLFLPILQTAALAAAAVSIFSLGSRYLSRPRALILTLLYCFYPPIYAMSSASFHPAVLAVPFITAAIVGILDRKPLSCAICLILALVCDSRIGLLVLPIMVWASAAFSDRKWIAASVVTAGFTAIGWIPFRSDEGMGPWVFCGALTAPYLFWGLAKLEYWTDQQLKKRSLLLAAISPLFFAGVVFASAVMGPAMVQTHPGVSHLTVRKSAVNALLDRIPESAEVITTPIFMPRLSNRPGVTLLGADPSSKPAASDYALVDLGLKQTSSGSDQPTADRGRANSEKISRLQTLLKDGWRSIGQVGNVVLLSGNPLETEKKLFATVDLGSDRPFLVLRAAAERTIELVGFTMVPDAENVDVIHFSFYWRKLKDSEVPFTMSLGVMGPDGNAIHLVSKPLCYGLYPFTDWKTGEAVREDYAFVVPERLQNTSYEVRLAVQNDRTGATLPLESRVAGALDADGRVRLIALDAI